MREVLLPCLLIIRLCSSIAREAMYLFVALTSADGYKSLLDHLGPDPKVRLVSHSKIFKYTDGLLQESSLFLVTLGPKVPGGSYFTGSPKLGLLVLIIGIGPLRRIAAWVVRTILGDEIFAACLENSRIRSTKEFFDTVAKRDELRKRWFEQVRQMLYPNIRPELNCGP